jgi:adenosylhomocysteine nucleosidase
VSTDPPPRAGRAYAPTGVGTQSDHRVLVLCPMRIERDAVAASLRRAGVEARAKVVQTGVGKRAIVGTLERELAAGRPPVVVLAGACGGLTPTPAAPPIARVIDLHGSSWTVDPALGGAPEPRGVTLVAVDEVISTPADKATLAQRTGAAVVDMESHAFCALCVQRGVRWTVVRGVSDTPDQTLPGEVLGWISPEGDTRAIAAAVGLVTRPRLIPHIAGVVRRSRRVLPMVGARVADIVRGVQAR